MGAYLLPDSDGMVPLSPIFPTAAQMGHKFPPPRAFLTRLISEIEDDDKNGKTFMLG
jgi:hypothetical protein